MRVGACWAYRPVNVTVTPCNDCATLHIWEGTRYMGGEVSLTLSEEQLGQIERAIREYRERKNTPATVAIGAGAGMVG